MSRRHAEADLPRPASSSRRLIAQLRLCASFYLGLGAPAAVRTYPHCRVWVAAGYTAELVRELLALYRGEGTSVDAEVREINFRCADIALADGRRFFVKEFSTRHPMHTIERAVRCSRACRAWRAAHLLPRRNILTPRAIGRAILRAGDEAPVEYLATKWLDGAIPYHIRLRGVGDDTAARRRLLEEFVRHLRHWNDSGVYLRDLVTNVATRDSESGIEYWLTDLDQLHPLRRLTRRRLLHQMGQLARWSGPLCREEARAIAATYLGTGGGRQVETIEQVLLATPPAESW